MSTLAPYRSADSCYLQQLFRDEETYHRLLQGSHLFKIPHEFRQRLVRTLHKNMTDTVSSYGLQAETACHFALSCQHLLKTKLEKVFDFKRQDGSADIPKVSGVIAEKEKKSPREFTTFLYSLRPLEIISLQLSIKFNENFQFQQYALVQNTTTRIAQDLYSKIANDYHYQPPLRGRMIRLLRDKNRYEAEAEGVIDHWLQLDEVELMESLNYKLRLPTGSNIFEHAMDFALGKELLNNP